MVPSGARELKEAVVEPDIWSWVPSMPGGKKINFDNPDYALGWIIENGNYRDYMEGGVSPIYPIRQCAREKNLENCLRCSVLEPCERFGFLPGVIKEKLLTERRRVV